MPARRTAHYCACGARLAADNRVGQCAACNRRDRELEASAPKVPPEFWTTDQMRDALAAQHIGRLSAAYRLSPLHRRPISQERLGLWLGLTQAQVSRVESGPPVRDLDRLVHWAITLRVPPELLWFDLPGLPRRPRDAASPALRGGRVVPRQPDRASVPALGADPEQQQHVTAALDDPRRYLDRSVVAFFGQQFERCKADDGEAGPRRVLPTVLGMLGAIQQHARDVKPGVRRALLGIGADGAEFAGWLYRDLHDLASAARWYDRAMEWAQEAQDGSMQAYVLIKKSQMAYDSRELGRTRTLAEAAGVVSPDLRPSVRAEQLQQVALGLATHGEPLSVVERKLDAARQVLVDAEPGAEQSGPGFFATTLDLRAAAIYTEAGVPGRAASIFDRILADGVLSRRDTALFSARRAAALALSGQPDEAVDIALGALELARATSSERTLTILGDVVRTLEPWRGRPRQRDLREALGA